ncbi:MAG: hypothetical protein HZA19_06910 [Nitrospirae bacterium]|nr:hypothetical protein [Nitrospirota bacterium]
MWPKKNLDQELRALEIKKCDLQTKLEAAENRQKKAEADLQVAQGRLAELREKQGALRLSRQEALAIGQDVEAATKDLRRLGEEVELVEDKVTGLRRNIEASKAEIRQLTADLKLIGPESLKIRLRHAALEYNELAPKLAAVCEKMARLRQELDFGGSDVIKSSSYGNTWDGELAKIPRLLPGHEVHKEPQPHWDSGSFVQRYHRELESQRREATVSR